MAYTKPNPRYRPLHKAKAIALTKRSKRTKSGHKRTTQSSYSEALRLKHKAGALPSIRTESGLGNSDPE